MKSTITLFFMLCFSGGLMAQTTATFEDLNLGANTFLNNAGGDAGFQSGHCFFPNDYNAQFDSWSGWAISTVTDNQMPGFLNQYSAITGKGQDASETYAVSYASPTTTIHLTGAAMGGVVEGLYLTNSTYAYFSILEGDGFAKKFGGETGDDPDFFRLTIRKYLDGELGADSIDFYLADYRFTDNSQDYIVNEWTYLELSSLGNADSLLFTMASTDISSVGINTPTYFCIDNLTTTDMPTATLEEKAQNLLRVFPNPVVDQLSVEWSGKVGSQLTLWSLDGQLLLEQFWTGETGTLDLSGLTSGMYFLKVNDGTNSVVRKIVNK